MAKTLNYVDKRLIDHGRRVAFLMFKTLERRHAFNDKQLRDICILAMLHDVGAYKTEEIDKMIIFEINDMWEHSIYGYLFLKYFSPLKELAPSILWHHANCDKIAHLEPTHKFLANLIYLCDRADLFLQNMGDANNFLNYIKINRNIKFIDDVVDMFLALDIDLNSVFKNIDSDIAYNRIFRETPLSDEEINGYIKMIIFSIDFRSSQTVIHTIATASIAVYLANLLGMDKKEIEKIKMGAMLHDIGKIGIPTSILECSGNLSDAYMKIMKKHVNITEKILSGNIDEDIKNIAVNHHEKLDGTGYSKHLSANEISQSDRIVAIADIFSALCNARNYKRAFNKKETIAIFKNMMAKNLLDAKIVALAVEHFDGIIETLERESKPVAQAYNDINAEYTRIIGEVQS